MSYVSTLFGKKSVRAQRAHEYRQAALAGAVETLEHRRLLSTVSISSPSTNEGGNLVYTVSLDQASNKALTVNYNANGGTAKVGRDYIAKSGKLTFSAGQTSKTIVIKTKDNNLYSPDKTVLVKLSGVTAGNKIQGKGTGTGTIVNTDAAPVITVNNPRVTEGDSGTKVLTFNVKMNGGSETPVKINYKTQDVTATSKGKNADYNAAKGTLTFNAKGKQQVKVIIRNDNTAEANEAFLLKLTAAKGTTVTLPALGYAVGAIVNDDGGNVSPGTTVTAVPQTLSVNPGTTAGLTVTLNQVSADPVTVTYSTADGTATAGDDYAATTGTVTFAVGETSKTVLVPTLSTADGGNFTVNLSAPTAGAVVAGNGPTINITNAVLPGLSVSDTSVTEGNSGSKTVTFTVSLAQASSANISVGYTLAGVTATAGSDFTGASSGTLVFAAGETTKTITATVLGDTEGEADETFTVTLGAPVNAPITKALGTATIINDDGAVDTSGVTFDFATTGHAFTLGKLSAFNYGLTNSRATPVHNLVMEFYQAPSNTTDFTGLTPYATVAIGTINAGQTLTGSVDLTGSPDPASGTRYFTRLVSNGLQYDVDQSVPFN